MNKTIRHLLLLLLVSLHAGSAFAQADPRLTAGQLPVIVIFPDTSGSMEYIDQGDEQYPHIDPYPGADGDGDGTDDDNLISLNANPLPGELAEWVPGSFMDYDDGNRPSGPVAFGSCIMWEPSDCSDCYRPSWNAQELIVPEDWMPEYRVGADLMRSRFNQYIRGNCNNETAGGCGGFNVPARLHWLSQPRHVTVKEVLTGDMILLPQGQVGSPVDSFNSKLFGPGCWFVPRQHDASIQPLADQNICGGGGDFDDFPDYDAPRPHFQEVYDGQLSNGLMDALTGAAIFAVVGFDGYRDDTSMNWDNGYGGNDDINDDIDGNQPGNPAVGFREDDNNCKGIAGQRCYDLGIYRVVAPTDLQIPSRFLPELSEFTQIALRDFGYLHEDTNFDQELTSDESDSQTKSYMGASFSNGFDQYYDDYYLGKHPLAKATPVAAAMMDLHQWFAYGQDGVDTFNTEDDFAECRPKHIILLTDGAPDPELGDPTLTAAFGNDPNRYIYQTTEDEIDDMVQDVYNIIPPAGAGFDELYSVRTHVVGLNIGDADAIDKMTLMAMAGQSCAGEALGANWQGAGCANGICLVDQPLAGGYNYTRGDGVVVPCPYPALILDRNDRDSLQAALSSVFNQIIGASAVSSRTRTVVTNQIDTDALPLGGQHRVFSGVKIDGNQWWKGILNRQTQECPDLDNPNTRELHEDVGNQVQINGAGLPSDNRRIFTSFVEGLIDYTTNPPTKPTFLLPPSGNDTFPMRYKFASSNVDEFGTSYIKIPQPPTLANTRVPFEYNQMLSAYSTAHGGLPLPAAFHSYMNTLSQLEVENAVNNFSARVPNKAGDGNGGNLVNEAGRALGGFLNSNPVIVEPPNLSLPIESYRAFKAKYADRSTMLYVNTMDGLLHALHIGEREDKVRVRAQTPANAVPGGDVTGDSIIQREAFAYLPQLIHENLSSNVTSQPYFFDGTPVVKDVRLCRADDQNNVSPLCNEIADGFNFVAAVDQWRTVLVQTAGLAGDGIYAIDITRSGGPILDTAGNLVIEDPDPFPLWEFDRSFEAQQIASAPDTRFQGTGALAPIDVAPCLDATDFYAQPMLGLTISQPEIGTILMEHQPDGATTVREQRAVAVFGAGSNIASVNGCAGVGIGYAIYVMDLQSGSVIRRFTEHVDGAGIAYPFIKENARFTGSPALFDASPGSVATRGFIGDQTGRMFRMDFSDPNPSDWNVELFFDPNTDAQATAERDSVPGTNGFPFGPAAYKPAISTNKDRQAVVIYGLGDPSDTSTNSEAQAVLSLTDQGAGSPGTLNWIMAMEAGEKLTGSPLVFDSVAYWPSYIIPANDQCEPGLARIYGVRFEIPGAGVEPFGIWQDNAEVQGNAADLEIDTHAPDQRWFGPKEPTLIRGLTLTLRSPCNLDDFGQTTANYNEGDDAQPQIIAQTSGDDVSNSLKNRYSGAGNDPVDRMVVNVSAPRSQSLPLDWAVVY